MVGNNPTPTALRFQVEGEAVSSWLYTPEEAPARALVVLCAGYTGTKFAAFYQPYVANLLAAGFAVALFDYRGWGESEGGRGRVVPAGQVADARAVARGCADHISSDRDGFRSLPVAMMGVSFGGGVAAAAAAQDDNIGACVSISGVMRGDWLLQDCRSEAQWQEFLVEVEQALVAGGRGEEVPLVKNQGDILIPTPERLRTNVKGAVPPEMTPALTPLTDADGIRMFRPLEHAELLGGTWTLLLAVAGDQVVPPKHSEAMFARLGGPKRLRVFPPVTSHYAAYVDLLKPVTDEVVGWLDRWLEAAPKGSIAES